MNAEVGASGKVILLIGTGVELAHHHLARGRVERANTSCRKEAAGVVAATDTDRAKARAAGVDDVLVAVLVDVHELEVRPVCGKAVGGLLGEGKGPVAAVREHLGVAVGGEHEVRIGVAVDIAGGHARQSGGCGHAGADIARARVVAAVIGQRGTAGGHHKVGSAILVEVGGRQLIGTGEARSVPSHHREGGSKPVVAEQVDAVVGGVGDQKVGSVDAVHVHRRDAAHRAHDGNDEAGTDVEGADTVPAQDRHAVWTGHGHVRQGVAVEVSGGDAGRGKAHAHADASGKHARAVVAQHFNAGGRGTNGDDVEIAVFVEVNQHHPRILRGQVAAARHRVVEGELTVVVLEAVVQGVDVVARQRQHDVDKTDHVESCRGRGRRGRGCRHVRHGTGHTTKGHRGRGHTNREEAGAIERHR